MDPDWSTMFTFSVAPLEIFIRGTIVYWFIFVLLRLAGRRDVGVVVCTTDRFCDALVVLGLTGGRHDSSTGGAGSGGLDARPGDGFGLRRRAAASWMAPASRAMRSATAARLNRSQ